MGTPGRVLVAATSSMALLVLDSSIVGVMLPSMRHDLSFGTATANWVVSSYLLTLAVLLPVGGRISDSIGAPRAFMAGAGGFALASLLIGVSQGPIELLVGRAAAGVAAAVMMPATLALIFDAYPEDGRAKAMSIYAGAGQAFATVGPAFGGLCAEFASWRVGFLVNVPIGVLAIALLLSATRSSSVSSTPSMAQSRSTTVDLYGLLTLTAGLFGISFGLMQLPAWGAGSAAVLLALVLGVVSAGLFVRHCWTRADGLLDLRLFSDRVFGGSTVVLAALGFAMTVTTIYTAVVLQTTLDLSPAAAGIALLPLVVPLLIATRWAGTRYNEVGPRALGVAGSAALGVGSLVIALGLGTSTLWVLCLGLIPSGVGIGLLMSPMTTSALATVPASLRGQGSGITSTSRQLGGILGIAVFGIAASAFSHHDSTHTANAAGFVLTAALMAAAAVVAAFTLGPKLTV